LCFDMLQALRASQSEVVQIRQLAQEWFALLMNYTTFEVSLQLASVLAPLLTFAGRHEAGGRG